MADRLVTPEELASALQRDDLDRATCELLIEGATAVVQALVGQRLLQATSTVVLEPVYGGMLDLPQRPVISVESVLIGAEEVTSDGWQLVGDRLFRYAGWRSYDYGGFAPPITVEYTHGYTVGDRHLELARSAVIALASQVYSNPDSVTREQIGDVATSYEKSSSALEASPFLRQALIRCYGQGAGLITFGAAQTGLW